MRWIVFVLIVVTLTGLCYSQQIKNMERITGVTISNIHNTDDIITALKELPVKTTARIVFDPSKPASYYLDAAEKIHNASYTMGELLDSYYMKNFTTEQYEMRTRNYVDSFASNIDVWEIGNEVNGEWLGDIQSVTEKVLTAFRIVKSAGKSTALTLYYNTECTNSPEHEMFGWMENIPQGMKDSLDFVFVSYYEDDCAGFQPDWQSIFDRLHVIFPNSKLGIGECGTKYKKKKKEFIMRYYNMDISTPNFTGGFFWWYFVEDCVPNSKPLWKTLYSVLSR